MGLNTWVCSNCAKMVSVVDATTSDGWISIDIHYLALHKNVWRFLIDTRSGDDVKLQFKSSNNVDFCSKWCFIQKMWEILEMDKEQ